MDEVLAPALNYLVANFPTALAVIGVIGTLRLINKPLFAFLHSFVLITPTKKDDEMLGKVESSRAYKAVVFILDWLGSVKLLKG